LDGAVMLTSVGLAANCDELGAKGSFSPCGCLWKSSNC
jgi:hypothetical protein